MKKRLISIVVIILSFQQSEPMSHHKCHFIEDIVEEVERDIEELVDDMNKSEETREVRENPQEHTRNDEVSWIAFKKRVKYLMNRIKSCSVRK